MLPIRKSIESEDLSPLSGLVFLSLVAFLHSFSDDAGNVVNNSTSQAIFEILEASPKQYQTLISNQMWCQRYEWDGMIMGKLGTIQFQCVGFCGYTIQWELDQLDSGMMPAKYCVTPGRIPVHYFKPDSPPS